jgi:CheY-like chemotaxis protein
VRNGHGLTEDEELRLLALAKSGVLEVVHSPERLLDETALFLHRPVASLQPAGRELLERLHQSDAALAGKQVLVVDDDVRNIFALSSHLERHGMRVLSAATGQEALDLVQKHTGIALVLMDIMLPEMDGYETMRRLRQDRRFRLLPIIALTAKAMKGDRERSLDAGASDYIAKPVNTEQLTALLRLWLHR